MDNLASIIEHTALRPELPLGRYTDLCREAIKYRFPTVCVSSFHTPLVSNLLHAYIHTDMNLSINVCSVIGFPSGISSIDSKVAEMQRAFNDGAVEFDSVINISAVKTGDWLRVKHELEALRSAVPDHVGFHPILKCILEVALLTDDEIKQCCDLAVETRFDFVKTSTGFSKPLEPIETARYVKLMVDQVRGTPVLVKASGFIKTLKDCELMVESGASRIGTSNGVSIMLENNGR